MAFLYNLTTSILVPTFLPLILVVLAGLLMGRFIPKLDDRTLSASMLFVFTPALVMFAILTASQDAGKQLAQIAFFWFFHTSILLFACHHFLRALRFSVHQRRLLLLTVLLLNAANYPIPLNEFQYGPAGRECAVRIMLVTQIIYVTIGVYLASDKVTWIEGVEEVFRLPLLYAAIIGFGLYFLGFRLPGYHEMSDPEVLAAGVVGVSQAADGAAAAARVAADTEGHSVFAIMLGKLLTFLQAPALPLNLMMLGILIGKGFYVLDFDSYRRMLPAVCISAALRLLLSPALGLVLIFAMGIEGQLARSLLIHTAMPTAIYVSIFVSYYGQPSDKRYVAMCIIVSTLVSLVTVPLLLTWINSTTLANFQIAAVQ